MLPKEIVDKITKEANDFAGKQGKDYPIDIVYKHMIQSQIADAYKAAALHYSQIIEEKDRQINELKMRDMTHEYNEAEAERFRPEYEKQLLEERNAEIKKLKAIIKQFEERAKLWTF